MQLLVGADWADISSTQVSLVADDTANLSLAIDAEQLTLTATGLTAKLASPSAPVTAAISACELLTVTCRSCSAANATRRHHVNIPSGSNLRFEFIGVEWSLEELSVIGGR